MKAKTFAANKKDLGIYSESPFVDRVQKFLNKLLIFFLRSLLIRDIIFSLILAFIFTFQIRKHSDSVIIDILFIVISFIIYFVLGLLLLKILPKINQLFYGRPVFGKIGGQPRRMFFTTLKCADAIKFEFKPEDVSRVKEFGKLDRMLTEQLLKLNYKKIRPVSEEAVADSFENEWTEIWNQQILKVRTFNKNGNEITFDSIMAVENISIRVEMNKLSLVSLLISSVSVFFQIVMIFIIWLFANERIALVTVFQIGLIISLILSATVFAYHSHQNAEIPMADMSVIPEEVIDPLKESISQIGNEPFRPSKVAIQKGYLPIIRNYIAKHVFWFGMLNSVILLLLLGLSFLIGLIWQHANISASLPWYTNMGLGLLLIPFGFLIGFYLMFLAIQNFRLLIAPVIVGILAVILPFLLDYLFSGEFDITKFNAAFLAAGTAIVTGIVTVITTKIKGNIEGRN